MAITKRTGEERPRPKLGKKAKDTRVVRFVDLNKNLGEVESEIQRVEDLIGGGVKSLHYIASLSQSGTDAPVATVLRNDFDGDVVWSRTGVGQYLGTLVGAFVGNVRVVEPPSLVGGKVGEFTENVIGTTDDAVTLQTLLNAGGTNPTIILGDGLLKSKDSYIEIIKYLD